MKPLAGKVAVVTGASKGMGRMFVHALVDAGAKVAAIARPSVELNSLRDDLGNRVLAVECDITDSMQVNNAITACVGTFGQLDLLVNNAAIFHPFLTELATDEDISGHFNTNVLGSIWMIRAAIPYLKKTKGQIVSISSESVVHPFPMLATYAATKAAVETLSTALADELRTDGIRVSVLRSGSVAGGSGSDAWSTEAKKAFYAKIMATGHAQMAGAAASAESMAKALIAIVGLPDDVCPRLIDVRAARSGVPEGTQEQ